jgi:hypothetical protein
LVIAFFGISSPQFQLWYWANSHLFFRLQQCFL